MLRKYIKATVYVAVTAFFFVSIISIKKKTITKDSKVYILNNILLIVKSIECLHGR